MNLRIIPFLRFLGVPVGLISGLIMLTSLIFGLKSVFFLGYSALHKGYKCLHVPSNRVYISRDVVFDENIFPFAHMPTSHALPPPTESSLLSADRFMDTAYAPSLLANYDAGTGRGARLEILQETDTQEHVDHAVQPPVHGSSLGFVPLHGSSPAGSTPAGVSTPMVEPTTPRSAPMHEPTSSPVPSAPASPVLSSTPSSPVPPTPVLSPAGTPAATPPVSSVAPPAPSQVVTRLQRGIR